MFSAMKTPKNHFLRCNVVYALSGALLALLATVALTGCSGKDGSSSPSALKKARIILAEDTRTISEELKLLLHDPDPQIRALAARAIGRIGIDSAPLSAINSVLQPNLHDSVVFVSAMTAFAYGLLPKDSTLANDMIEYAFTAPPEAALNAIVSAGRLADSVNTPVIQKMMILLNHPQPSYRAHTAMALLFSNAKSAIDALTQVALADSAKSVRDTALYALARMKAKKAKDVYLAYLNDTDAYLQSLALRGLSAVNDTALVEKVLPFLKAKNVNLRSQAIATLATLTCQKSKEALTDAARNDSDSRLKAQALSALAGFPGSRDDNLALHYLTGKSDLGLQTAAVTYLAGSFNGVLSSALDSALRNGSPALLTAFFEGLNRKVAKKRLYQFCEELLHAPQYHASGPAYYACYELYDKLDLHPKDWMTGKTLWKIISSDTDFVIKTAMLEYAGRQKSPWFFDVALPLARLLPKSDSPIQKNEFEDVYRSLLTATESFLGADMKTQPEQIQQNVREIFNLCLQADDYIVSKQAATDSKKYFDADVARRIHKPQPHYTEAELSSRLTKARQENKFVALKFDDGEMTIALDYDSAPLACLNVLKLIDDGVYEHVTFHRVIPNFVAQGGDPRGDGWGGPGYSIRCEYSQRPYVRGTVGIATSGKDTGGSQFFITLSPQPHLGARYTVFGSVTDGLQRADRIQQGDTARMIKVAVN